jgi:hypothetical protein
VCVRLVYLCAFNSSNNCVFRTARQRQQQEAPIETGESTIFLASHRPLSHSTTVIVDNNNHRYLAAAATSTSTSHIDWAWDIHGPSGYYYNCAAATAAVG